MTGSWRLGIHEEGADVDMVCVCPRFCSHDLFFGRFGATLKAHPHVTEFHPIPGAFVSILTFNLRDVEIDLLLAVLPHLSTVPGTFDILEDTVLPDMDEKSRRSLNGPRDTLTIEKLVRSAGSHLREPPDAGVRYVAFLSTVRVVRMWAKRRCLYSNKMGYLGGINFNILVAMIVQMYPRKGVGALLVRFFEVRGVLFD
jgi:poly(A) polymerase